MRPSGNAWQEDWRQDGGYRARIRNQFMLEKGFTYMNNGTLGPTILARGGKARREPARQAGVRRPGRFTTR